MGAIPPPWGVGGPAKRGRVGVTAESVSLRPPTLTLPARGIMHLTNNMTKGNDSLVSTAGAVEAGAPVEIGVTREMCDAGLMAAERHYIGDGRYNLTEDCLSEVYLAMHRVHLSPALPDDEKFRDVA